MFRGDKKAFLCAAVFFITLFMIGDAGAVTIIKIAHTDPGQWTASKSQAVGEVFKAMVESGTGGQFKVEVYPASQLGGERAHFEGVKIGTIEMALVTESPISQFFKPIMVLSIPYLFRSETVAWTVLDGPFGKELAEAIRKATGCLHLGYGEVGFRHFSNSKRPLRKLEDYKGLKFRVMESPVYIALVKALGASAVPMAFPEVYTGLQQGVVDGQENPVSTFMMSKLNEVQKYLSLDGHLYSPQNIVINEKIFQGYPKEVRDIITEAAKVCSTVSRGVQVTQSFIGVSEAMQKGTQIYVPTIAEKEALKKASQGPVIEYLKKELGAAGEEWMNKLFKAIRDAEAKLAQK